MNANKKRHSVLNFLYEKYSINESGEANDWVIDFNTICTNINCTKNEYRLLSPKLIDEKEVEIWGIADGLYITPKGITSFQDQKYLKENIKKINDAIYDITKWVLPSILLAITIYTSVKTAFQAKDIKQLRQEVKQLHKEVDTLKQARQSEYRAAENPKKVNADSISSKIP